MRRGTRARRAPPDRNLPARPCAVVYNRIVIYVVGRAVWPGAVHSNGKDHGTDTEHRARGRARARACDGDGAGAHAAGGAGPGGRDGVREPDRGGAGERAERAGDGGAAGDPADRAAGGRLRADDGPDRRLRDRRCGRGGSTQADFDPARLNYPAEATQLRGRGGGGAAAAQRGRAPGPDRGGAGGGGEPGERRRGRGSGTRVDGGEGLLRGGAGGGAGADAGGGLAGGARARDGRREAMVTHGLATKSDALLAAVKAGEVDAQLAEARGGCGWRGCRLATLLGTPEDTALRAAGAAAGDGGDPGAVGGGGAVGWAGSRADVRAARHGLAAAAGGREAGAVAAICRG